MTRAQKIKHNKSIKLLFDDYVHSAFNDPTEVFAENKYRFRSRFHSLYFADNQLVFCSAESLRKLIYLRYHLDYMPSFGCQIKINSFE